MILTALTIANWVRKSKNSRWGLGIGDWGLGIGDWGLGIGDWGLENSIYKAYFKYLSIRFLSIMAIIA